MRKRWKKLLPIIAFVTIGMVAAVMEFGTAARPGSPGLRQGADLYVIVNGHKHIVDSWSAPANEKMPMRRVSLSWCNAFNGCYGPSAGGDYALYGVDYWWSFQCLLFTPCKIEYAQQYVGGWFLGNVLPRYAAQYSPSCPSGGIVPRACTLIASNTKEWDMTRDTHNVMWQWNYLASRTYTWHSAVTGIGGWINEWGEMHMMGDGTMWWDAGGAVLEL